MPEVNVVTRAGYEVVPVCRAIIYHYSQVERFALDSMMVASSFRTALHFWNVEGPAQPIKLLSEGAPMRIAAVVGSKHFHGLLHRGKGSFPTTYVRVELGFAITARTHELSNPAR